MDCPILIDVSLTPSVSDQPTWHFVRSTVQPPGPVRVLPSADLPHPLSLICLTAASRCLAHRASHSVSEVGGFPAVVDAVAPAAVVDGDVTAAPPVVVALEVSSPSSPPQAAPTRARLNSPAPSNILRVPPPLWTPLALERPAVEAAHGSSHVM